jgi:hypothetical protein
MIGHEGGQRGYLQTSAHRLATTIHLKTDGFDL